jgi:hypothetical protein
MTDRDPHLDPLPEKGEGSGTDRERVKERFKRRRASYAKTPHRRERQRGRRYGTRQGMQDQRPQTGFLAVELDWTNAGKSPALRIRGTAEYRVDLMGGPFNAGCATLKKTVWETSESLLLAGDEFRLTLQSLPRNWNEKAKILSIHGRIRYADVLTNQQRTTEFCEEVTNIRGIVLVGECTRPYFGVPLLDFKPFIFK